MMSDKCIWWKWSCPQPSQAEPLSLYLEFRTCYYGSGRALNQVKPNRSPLLRYIFRILYFLLFFGGSGRDLNQVKPNLFHYIWNFVLVITGVVVPSTKSSRTAP